MNTKFTAQLAGITLAAVMMSIGGAAAYSNPNRISTPDLAVQTTVAHTAAITPLAMQYFCAAHSSECASGSRANVALTQGVLEVLKRVNRHVNSAITPVADASDTWSLNPTRGDCEDYVLSKRSALIRSGLPSGALRIAYTHTRRGEPHAVLVVKTSNGDYVLDNLTNSVKSLRASGYQIRSMSTANPGKWTIG